MKYFKLNVSLLILMWGCSPQQEHLPFYNEATLTPIWVNEEEVSHSIASFQFKNQEGQLISSEYLSGKIYVANFFFTTCPSICPKITNNLSIIQEQFSDNPKLNLVSFSVMPWIDSIAQLNAYAKQMNITAQQWHLLTGPKEEIYTLARQSFFAEASEGILKAPDEFLHTENVILVDPKGHIRGVYNGTLALEMERFGEDIETLLQEID